MTKLTKFLWDEGDLEVLEKHGKKAAAEPEANVRGQPLPKDEALEGWEVTEKDVDKAQAWVDGLMKAAGFD